MIEKLKPCPFCGGEVSIADMGEFWTVTRGTEESSSCHCRVFMESDYYDDAESKKKTREVLVRKWNSRKGNQRKTEGISPDFRKGIPTEEGWYLLKVKLEDEVIYDTNQLIPCLHGLDWRFCHEEIIGWRRIEEEE